MIDFLKLWADNNNNNYKTQVFTYALCQWTYVSAFEIFGDMLKRRRLNCYIKYFTEKTKHWCFEVNSWSKHQCFHKHRIWHMCFIHIRFQNGACFSLLVWIKTPSFEISELSVSKWSAKPFLNTYQFPYVSLRCCPIDCSLLFGWFKHLVSEFWITARLISVATKHFCFKL